MKKTINTVAILLVLSFTSIYASNGQNYYRYGKIDTKLNKRAILEIAKQELRRLVIMKKIHKSWKSTPSTKITHHSSTNDWVVRFNNLKIKKKTKQNLYIFLNTYGDIKGANYTGN